MPKNVYIFFIKIQPVLLVNKQLYFNYEEMSQYSNFSHENLYAYPEINVLKL